MVCSQSGGARSDKVSDKELLISDNSLCRLTAVAFAWPWPGVCAAGLRGSSSGRIWRESGVAAGRGELRATFAEMQISNEGF